MCTLANSEDPDEMPHYAAFHQGLHCLQRYKHLQRKKYTIFLEIINLLSLDIYNGRSHEESISA